MLDLDGGGVVGDEDVFLHFKRRFGQTVSVKGSASVRQVEVAPGSQVTAAGRRHWRRPNPSARGYGWH